ncbi:MAG: universal stress protein [Firmicutes bacterium]|nr:universal stress protein [Bacillota bacterium]
MSEFQPGRAPAYSSLKFDQIAVPAGPAAGDGLERVLIMNSEDIKVLLPSDGSETSLKAAQYAARLMKMNPRKKVTLLVVVPAGKEFFDGPPAPGDVSARYDAILEKKALEVMEKTAGIFSREGLEVEKVLEKGDPARVILEYAGQGGFDHIIMGSRGVSELRGAALGSVSHKVINLAPCRVTLVK